MSVLDVVRILRTTKQADAAAQAAEAAKVARVAEQTKKAQSVQRIQVGSEVVEFPADMPDDKIKAALKKHYGPTATQQKITALEQENVALKNKPAEKPEVRITAAFKNKYIDDTDGSVKNILSRDDIEPVSTAKSVAPLYALGIEQAWLNTPKANRWVNTIPTINNGTKYNFKVTDGLAFKGDEYMDMILNDVTELSNNTSILTPIEQKLWISVAEKLRKNPKVANSTFVVTNTDSFREMNAAGLYLLKNDVSFIRKDNLKNGTSFFKTSIHEAVHAATMHELKKDTAFSRLTETLLAVAKKESPDHPAAPVYGYTDKLEFAAEALSNPSFFKRLKDIDTPTGSVADRFLQVVTKILGLGAVAIGTAEYDALEKIVAPQEVESDGA